MSPSIRPSPSWAGPAQGLVSVSEPTLEVAGCSERGSVRQRNEDFFAYYLPQDPDRRAQDGALFVIADGVGGGTAGNAASAEATNVLLQEYYFSRRQRSPRRRLAMAFDRVAAHLFSLAADNPAFAGMQTTLTALLLRGEGWWCAHVGDSKLFLLRDGQIRQLTRDHSLVQEMVRWSILRRQDIPRHPARHILTRSLGPEPFVRPDTAGGRWLAGDTFLLCTDGLVEHVAVEELATWVQIEGVAGAVRRAVDVANLRGGTDNLTLLVVRVGAAAACRACP